MTAALRVLKDIAGGYGAHRPGAILWDVDVETATAWVAAGLVEEVELDGERHAPSKARGPKP